MAKPPPLDVWLHGIRVGTIATNARPGNVAFSYSAEAQYRWPGGTPILSCSLPVQSRRTDASLWFRGLLPEGRARDAMAARANVAIFNTFVMLARFGRDVAGAVTIGEQGHARTPAAVPYTDDTLADEVAGLEDRPLAIYDDSELSLPGLQNKLLLVRTGGGWARPVGGEPSTHILKAEDRRYPGMADREVACLHLAARVGLTTVDATVHTYAGIPCLIVSRYDRTTDADGTVTRVHQEDICQATGRNPDAAKHKGKYEAYGGPGFADVAALLDLHSRAPVDQLVRLAKAMAFTVAIGNADAHGKNLSLLLTAEGHATLAPLYDTVPTAVWPQLPATAAMRVNGRTNLASVTFADLTTEATSWRIDPDTAADAVASTIAGLADAADDIDAPDDLVAALKQRCDQLAP